DIHIFRGQALGRWREDLYLDRCALVSEDPGLGGMGAAPQNGQSGQEGCRCPQASRVQHARIGMWAFHYLRDRRGLCGFRGDLSRMEPIDLATSAEYRAECVSDSCAAV